MTQVDIKKDEIQALDILLEKTEVKPIVGYKVINFRIRIQNTLQAEATIAKVEKKDDGKKANRKINKNNKK